ncbi:MAG: GIY-YIG nuclease family protein [Alphaproteobacteria bacterium]
MFYVYLIKSISHPEQKCIGQTDDLKKRLKQHNAGYSIHTAKYKPWELVNYFAFSPKDDTVYLLSILLLLTICLAMIRLR